MQQRDVSIIQALTVIRMGEIISGPARDEFGEWRYKFAAVAAGRKVQVIVATDCISALTVVTVIEWRLWNQAARDELERKGFHYEEPDADEATQCLDVRAASRLAMMML